LGLQTGDLYDSPRAVPSKVVARGFARIPHSPCLFSRPINFAQLEEEKGDPRVLRFVSETGSSGGWVKPRQRVRRAVPMNAIHLRVRKFDAFFFCGRCAAWVSCCLVGNRIHGKEIRPFCGSFRKRFDRGLRMCRPARSSRRFIAFAKLHDTAAGGRRQSSSNRCETLGSSRAAKLDSSKGDPRVMGYSRVRACDRRQELGVSTNGVHSGPAFARETRSEDFRFSSHLNRYGLYL
jgi:hypothetical protein